VSVARVREVNARLRAAGITVHEWPGWEARGNGQSAAYEGGIVHHTASGYGMALPGTAIGNVLVNGRSDLPGPLCNHSGNEDGSVTCIAAHPANHAGASGGRSMGPLPTTNLFNKRVMGLEIVYPGTSPMRDAQYRAAQVWARAVADVCGDGDMQRVRAHAEVSITGKWDPGYAPGRTIDMAAFRAAATSTSQGDNMGGEIADAEIQLAQSRISNTGKRVADFVFVDRAIDVIEIRKALAALTVRVDAGFKALSDDEANLLAAIRTIPQPGPVTDEQLDLLRAGLVAGLPEDLVDVFVNGLRDRLIDTDDTEPA
jgi:N-acetylmuramoyl-L-alanine amidase